MSRITSVQEVLTQLREFWGDELICGMRIGELLTLPIALPSCFRDLQQRARASTFDIAAPFYQKHILDLRLGVARKFGIPPDNLILKNRHMFFATNVFKSDLALLCPVAIALGEGNSLFVSGQRRLISSLPANFKQVGLYQQSYDRAGFIRHLKERLPYLRSRVIELVQQHGWGSKVRWLIEDALIKAVNLAFRWDALLAEAKPKSLLVPYDYHPSAFVSVNRARMHGIPTMTLQHGVIGEPLLWTPLVADKIIVWGQDSKDVLISNGVSSSRILVGGYPRLNSSLEYDPKVLPGKADAVGWPENRRDGIIILTTALNDDHENLWIKELVKVADELRDRPILIKCHPAEDSKVYKNAFAEAPNVFIASGKEWTLDEALALGDIVITRDSGAGVDALYQGKYLMVFKKSRQYDVAALSSAVKSGAAIYCDSHSSLVSSIVRLETDIDMNASVTRAREQWAKRFCAYSGTDAGREIARILESITNRESA